MVGSRTAESAALRANGGDRRRLLVLAMVRANGITAIREEATLDDLEREAAEGRAFTIDRPTMARTRLTGASP